MRFLASALLLSLLTTPAFATPWEDLFGEEKGKIWNDPEGRFTIALPIGWKSKVHKGAPVVDFWKTNPDLGYTAKATVLMRTLPPKVKIRHFAVRMLDQTKSSVQGFRMLSQSRRTVDGLPAIQTHFTYRERNNAQLTNEVVQIALVKGERGFVITLEVAAGTREVFWKDFGKMLKGFGGRAPGMESTAMPKARRRVRKGEMIHPDAVRY